MKYIVVYTIFILGLTSLNAEAQKPTIYLLPTVSESVHPEAMIDTIIIHDSLVLFDSLSPLHDSIRKAGTNVMYSGEASLVLRGRAKNTGNRIGLVPYPLIFRKINTIRFIIYFTALKF